MANRHIRCGRLHRLGAWEIGMTTKYNRSLVARDMGSNILKLESTQAAFSAGAKLSLKNRAMANAMLAPLLHQETSIVSREQPTPERRWPAIVVYVIFGVGLCVAFAKVYWWFVIEFARAFGR
jgi:hypothetical protein